MKFLALFICLCFIGYALCGPSGITFNDIARSGPISQYNRGFDPEIEHNRQAFIEKTQHSPIIIPHEMGEYPQQTNGAPGGLSFDYDNDGDEDIFVTNTAPQPHVLYKNMLMETGVLSFIEVAAAAGVDAPEQTGGGACASDIDNDGDLDLLVISQRTQHHKFFRNNGDGTFTDESYLFDVLIPDSNFGSAVACAFGDVNNDGLPDVYIGNSYHMESLYDCMGMRDGVPNPFVGGTYNNLLINYGTHFVDESIERGVYNYEGGITWGVGLVDYDQDGDLDLFSIDDQCLLPPQIVNRGRIGFYTNNGTGYFTDRSKYLYGVEQPGNLMPDDYSSPWMSVNWGTLDDDEFMDLFVTDMGSYGPRLVQQEFIYFAPSAWFLQNEDGSMRFPGFGDHPPASIYSEIITANPFGFGSEILDLNNDGHHDIIYGGGLDAGMFVLTDNPQCVLIGNGEGGFARDLDTGIDTFFHQRREVHGLWYADLNNDGFPDIMTVSGVDVDPAEIYAPYPPPAVPELGGISQFNDNPVPTFVPGFFPVNETHVSLREVHLHNGSITVEMNSGHPTNKWITMNVVGSTGRIPGAKNPRDGCGAVISATPFGKSTQTLPVMCGSSHASQSALRKNFGLGDSQFADVEVFWPATKARNYMHNVQHGSFATMYEIPCDIRGDSSLPDFVACCVDSANYLLNAGVISGAEKGAIVSGNIVGFLKYHP